MIVLRLAGAPGVGKSAVGWAAAQRMAAKGEPVGYVDIDQLGMCYPPPTGDPDRHGLKETALAAVARCFARAGARRLVVSGVAAPDQSPRPVPGTSTRSIWLDAQPEVRRARLETRGWDAARVDDVVAAGTAEVARLDPAWQRLVTDALTVEQTVEAVLSVVAHDFQASSTSGTPAAVSGSARLLWITGPRCAGASTIGFLIALAAWQNGVRTGFLDAAQLSFGWNLDRAVGPVAVAAAIDTFRAAGAEQLVVVAPLEFVPVDLGPSSAVLVRLDADSAVRGDRAVVRTRGEGPQLAGDDLLGLTPEQARNRIIAEEPEVAARPGEILLDTTDLGESAVAERVRALIAQQQT